MSKKLGLLEVLPQIKMIPVVVNPIFIPLDVDMDLNFKELFIGLGAIDEEEDPLNVAEPHTWIVLLAYKPKEF